MNYMHKKDYKQQKQISLSYSFQLYFQIQAKLAINLIFTQIHQLHQIIKQFFFVFPVRKIRQESFISNSVSTHVQETLLNIWPQSYLSSIVSTIKAINHYIFIDSRQVFLIINFLKQQLFRSFRNGLEDDEIVTLVAHPDKGPRLMTNTRKKLMTNQTYPALPGALVQAIRQQFTNLNGLQSLVLPNLCKFPVHIAVLYAYSIKLACILSPTHNQLPMQITPNIVQLEQTQIWNRNQNIKHWGNLKPMSFRKGQPTYILSSISTLTLIIAFAIFVPLQIILSPNSISDDSLLVITRTCVWMIQIYFTFKLYKTDPGIRSHSLPIINEREMMQMSNFCNKCKCSEAQSIKHCIFCDVCIENSYMHSKILEICITPANLKAFCAFWISVLFNSLICLLE